METIIEILIDNSGSMGGAEKGKFLIEGVTRMSLVKKILVSEIIPTFDYAEKIIVRTFHNNTKNLNDRACDNIHTPILYEGGFEKENIINIISNIKDPTGGATPITAAINVAVSDLIKYPQSDRKIILLTDGEENGGGDYKSAAKKALNLDGIPCKIFIVGLSQAEKAEKEALEIASGGYINIKSKSFSTEEIKRILIPFKTVVLQNTIQNIQQPLIDNQSQSSQYKSIEVVAEKIDSLKLQSQTNALQKLIDLEQNIQDQISNNQKFLSEINSLKDLFNNLLIGQNGVSSTTLTIDSEYSEELRKKSEQFVNYKLIEKYGDKNVKWLNQNGESGNNHDFEVMNENGELTNLIECKGTPREKKTFYLTDHEWHFFLSNKDKYQIYRVFNVEGEMNHVCIENLFNSLKEGDIVPYLNTPEILKEKRAYLTIKE